MSLFCRGISEPRFLGLDLPELKPEEPWFGYSLGNWGEDFDEAAGMAVRSEYWEYGRRIAQRRRGDVAMNTEVRDVDETLPDDL